jgi:uncharacterized membrane protein YdbT with pleckstrin-like domain
MGFPSRLLGDGEEVVLELHPHWKRLAVPMLCVPLVVGVATYLLFLLPDGARRVPLRWAVIGVAAVVVLRASVWPWLRWQSTLYVVTTRRLIVRTGVLSRSGRDIPLSRVNDVSFRRSLADRVLGAGTLTVESGGELGQLVLVDVPGVEQVQRTVARCVDTYDRRPPSAADDRD